MKNVQTTEKTVSAKVFAESLEMLGKELKNDRCMLAEVDKETGYIKVVVKLGGDEVETVIIHREVA